MAFEPDVRLGIGFDVLSGSLSFFCVSGILFYTAVKRSFGGAYGLDASDSNLFLSLMVADLFHAIGIMLNMRWEAEGVVTEGAFCTIQGLLKQIGNNAVSFTSLAITAYTFCVLVLVWVPRRSTPWVTAIFGIWFCTGLVVGIPNIVHRHETYYGNTGFWCFINSKYTVERLVTDYIWVWLSGIVMAILYSIMAVMVYRLGRGNINQAEHVAVARKLILYPIVYILCVLPNSVTRWMSFTQHSVPARAVLAANSLHALFGFFNFVVFCATRPAMVFGIHRSRQGVPNAIPLEMLHAPNDHQHITAKRSGSLDDASQW